MFREYDSALFLSLCTACTAVRAVTTEPCAMQRDKRSMLCALCMEMPRVSSGVSITCALHLDVQN